MSDRAIQGESSMEIQSKKEGVSEITKDPFAFPTAVLYDLRAMLDYLRADLEAEKQHRALQVEQLTYAIEEEKNDRQLSCQDIRHSLANAVRRIDGETDRLRRRFGDFDRGLLKEIKDRTMQCDDITKEFRAGLEDLRTGHSALQNAHEIQKSDAYAFLQSQIERANNSVDSLAVQARADLEQFRTETATAHSLLSNKHEKLSEEYDATKRHVQELTKDVLTLADQSHSVGKRWGALEDLKLTCVSPDDLIKQEPLIPVRPETPSTMMGTSPLTSQRCSPSPQHFRSPDS